MSKPEAFTKRQLETLDILKRNQQATLTLRCLLVAFFMILLTAIVGFFLQMDIRAIGGFIALDGIVGWGLKHIIVYLWPHRS